MTRHRAAFLAIPALAAALAAPPAHAQTALGDGRALDSSTRLGAQGRNPNAVDFAAEARYRNAIVTGNAPGGRSFRGSVGYSAPDDFRGVLGGDSTFAFRRDAFFSGIVSAGGQNLRGVDALRFQLDMSSAGFASGGATPVISRSPSISPQRLDMTAQSIEAAQGTFYDPLMTRPGALRATSEFVVGDALSPMILGQTTAPDGGLSYTVASPLRSVTTQPTPDARLQFPGLISRPVPSPAATVRAPETAVDARVSGRLEPARYSHQAILEQLRGAQRTRAAEPGEGEETLEQRLERLRRELGGEARDGEPMDPEALRDLTTDTLRGAQPEVSTLGPTPDEERDLFAEHMRRGEEMLAAERWFEAEERFTSAVAMRPDDALAAVGRAHAQLGAGLYRSSVENLKSLFRRHPEMLAVRFDERLLPREERLGDVSAQLRQRMDGASAFSRDSAFLLAYLGRQYGNPVDIADAFERIREITQRIGDPDPVFDAARAVWLADGN